MSEKKIILTLEEALRADTSGALQVEIFNKLKLLSDQLAISKQQPHEPEDYEAIEAAQQAVQSAQLVMQLFDTSQ